MAGPVGLKWEVIIPRLDVRGLWNAEMESKLAICEAAVLEVIDELRPAKVKEPE